MRFLLVFSCCWLLTTPIFGHSPKRPAVMANVSDLASNAELRSVGGRDITVIRIPAIDANGKVTKPKHRFYIQGGLHGNEKETSKFVAWLTGRVISGQSLLNKFAQADVSFDFVPIANPDGMRHESRYNKNAINLNRNFGYLWGLSRENPGSQKFSEPETKAIKYLLDTNKYTSAVDVHGYINWVVGPSTPSAKASAKRSQIYDAWTSALATETKLFDPTYQLKTAEGLGDGGAFEDYAFWRAGTMAFCLEMATAFRHVYQPQDGKIERVDLFESYEQLIYRLFKRSMSINRDGITITQN